MENIGVVLLFIHRSVMGGTQTHWQKGNTVMKLSQFYQIQQYTNGRSVNVASQSAHCSYGKKKGGGSFVRSPFESGHAILGH
jgi:hypothetical protein